MPFNYLEETGDVSPCSGNFTATGGGASCSYILSGPTYTQLQNTVIDVLGYTGTKTTDGRIRRRLPLRHPIYQWLFADSISHQGVGSAATLVYPSRGRGSPIVAQAPVYQTYHVRVGYGPRPYNCWQDKDVSVISSVGYEKSGGDYDFKYATEWYRFTTFEMVPANNFATAQQGQMVFRTGGTPAPLPNLQSFQDAPRMFLPDATLRVRWYQVPYRYLTSANSYLTRFIGHINQFRFGYLGRDNRLEPYEPGSLLYHGATPVQVYNPPVPDPGTLAFNFGDGLNRSKLCDLDLTFSYTARTIGSSTLNVPDYSAINRNWIVGGWNLLPWLTTRKFYYATSYDPDDADNQSRWYPSYNSFPFELLFTDPDAPGSPALSP